MDKGTSFGSDVANWLHVLDIQGKSRLTVDAYRRALAHFTRWSESTYGQPFAPSHVITRDVRDWRSFQQTVEKAAPATINQRLTAVQRFFNWAESQKLVKANPGRGIKGIPASGHQPKALTYKELRRILRAVHGSGDLRDIAIIEVLAGTGVRVSELLALQIEDIVIQPRSGILIIRKGKHDRQRTIPLTISVRTALQTYLSIHPERERTKAKLWWGERGPLRDRKAVTRILTKYAQDAHIAAFGPHTLRHTFATQYLAANPQDMRGLAALLGHASLDTVMVYTEPSIEDLAERMERIEQRPT